MRLVSLERRFSSAEISQTTLESNSLPIVYKRCSFHGQQTSQFLKLCSFGFKAENVFLNEIRFQRVCNFLKNCFAKTSDSANASRKLFDELKLFLAEVEQTFL